MFTFSHRDSKAGECWHITAIVICLTLLVVPNLGMTQEGGLQEIIVTARKRAENLQDIPESITVFSSASIDSAGLDSIDDVTLLVPNFSIVNSQNIGNNLITLRGISQVRFGEPPVAFIIDGVQSASPNNFTQEFFDLERIEILRGPQGAVYGRNAIGGALNITTKQPINEFEHFVSAEVGEGPYTKLRVGSSGPISLDKVLYRFAASYRDDHGLIDNVTLGRKVDFAEELSVRGRLLFYPTEQLTIDLRGFYADYDGGASYYAPTFPDFGESEGNRGPVEANTPGVGERELTDFSIKIDYETRFATLTSITAVSKITEFFFQDIDFLSMPIVNLDQDLDLTAWSEEFRLTSNTQDRFSWQLGLYYLATDRDVRTRVFLDFDPDLGPVISDLPELNDNTAYAVFGQISYDFSEKFNVAFAVRNDWDDREQFSPVTVTTVNEKFEKFQPKVALTYFLSKDTMVYFSAGRGFRSGGFNVPSPLFPLMFREETVDTYELGFKGTWMDRRIQINGALFHSEDDNTQIFQFDAGSGTQGILNLNNSEFDGVELEIAYRPNSTFMLSAGVGLIDSEITDFNGTNQFRGNQVPLVNQETYNLSAQYAFHLTHGLTLTPRLDFSSYGDLAWTIDNADQRTSNVNLLNLRLALDSDRWNVTAYAENLSDEDYDAEFNPAEFVGTPTDIYFPGRPRRIGISARLRF